MRDLWEAVAAAPGDDELLWVVADAFEERGDPQRAELVRLQLALSRGDPYELATMDLRWRERVLLVREGGRWRAELPRWDGVQLMRAERGFPAWVHARDPAALLRVVEQVPRGVSGLRLAELGSPGELDALPPLPWLRKLEIQPQAAVDRLPELLDSPLVHPGLTELSLQHQSLGDPDIARLAQRPELGGLRALRLRENHVGVAGMEAIAGSPHLRGLVELTLGTYSFGNVGLFGLPGVQVLLGWQSFPRLQVLDLTRQELDADCVTALLQAEGELRELDLSENPFAGLGRLASGGIRLQRLRARHCDLYDGDLQVLLDAPALSGVRSLDLGANRFGPSFTQRLVTAPCWSTLRELSLQGPALHRRLAPWLHTPSGPAILDLSKTSLDEEDLDTLSQAPWFGEVRWLRLVANPLRSRSAREGLWAGARELRHLALGPEGHSLLAGLPPSLLELQAPTVSPELAASALPELLSLDLSGNALDLASVRRLASAPWLPSLVELGLRGCRLPQGSLAALLAGEPRALRRLSLSLNPLGDELALLLDAPALARLEFLFLDPRGVSPALRDRFREPALPALRALFWQGERIYPPPEEIDWR
jgi:uncharacterized protein (TIGR02996 family)